MSNDKNIPPITDIDVVKALECCVNGECRDCPLYDEKSSSCLGTLTYNALQLYRHMQAELESLIFGKQALSDELEAARAEIERKVDEQKYHKAILVLQAIAQHRGSQGRGSNEYFNEWTQAWAFKSCREAALRCLKSLGEPVTMPNKRNGR